MRTPGPQPLDLLPPAGHRVGGGASVDAADRRAVPQDPVLREPTDGGRPEPPGGAGQSQAGPAAHEGHGIEALHPRPRTTIAAAGAKVYPYLLRDRVLTRADEVWSSDITYVSMRHEVMDLTAVIDWYSRYVLSWRLSNTLDGGFCLEALDEALSRGRPEIFNTDLGSQFTSREYTGRLEEAGVAVSRDGRGRALDNVFVERLWRSVKYEDIYIKDYERVCELASGLGGLLPVLRRGSPAPVTRLPDSGGSLPGRDQGEVEWGKAITNTGPPDCPVFGVHYNPEASILAS